MLEVVNDFWKYRGGGIIDYLHSSNYLVEFIRLFMNKGIPDLFIWNESDFYFVEVKSNKDSIGIHQIKFLEALNKLGIKTFVIWQNDSH